MSHSVGQHRLQLRSRISRSVVLYNHGNGGNITNLRQVLHFFRDQLALDIVPSPQDKNCDAMRTPPNS